ncbi:hypothetical protein [Methyloceanibacter sp. wino2]|uniref:hypothetical protein n=1 Tax=Methyloceanibacter sp. wino2 TaxID=2170729 RepID=UPI001573F1F8|nr:hypothetical protein [Methyloceanibacter sp. wino2]
MTVEQLLKALADMPKTAVVLVEEDGGLAKVGGIERLEGTGGMPDEVLLIPDMSE